jgi:MFS family permease
MNPPRSRRLPATVVSLGIVSLFNDIASEMIYPLLPAFLALILGAGPAALGVVEGIAESTASLGKAAFGWLSDRGGRRKRYVVAGYALSVVARPLVAVAHAWGVVAAIRFVDRVGKGIRAAPRDAMIAGAVDPTRRGIAYGFERAMDNAGALIGPLIAAALLAFVTSDVRVVFGLAVVPGLIALGILLAGTRDEILAPVPSGPAADVGAPLPRRFWWVVAIFTVFGLAYSSDAFLLLRARDLGMPMWQIPLLWSAFNGTKAALNAPAGAWTDRRGRVPVIVAGWLLYAGVYAAFGRVRGTGGIWALFILYAVFYALTEGAQRALVADLAGLRARGRAFGIFHTGVGLAALPASLLFGILWKARGARVAFDVDAVLALLSAAALLTWHLRGRTGVTPSADTAGS